MANRFQVFVEDVLSRPEWAGVKDRLARQIGFANSSAFWRHISEKGTLGLVKCLRLAIETGESPRRVLELAGKTEELDWIEKAFGPERAALTDVDRRLLNLPRGVKRNLVAALEAAADESPHSEVRPVKGVRASSR